MDLREIYGCSPWHRATFDLLAEEVARIGHAALMSGMVFALPRRIGRLAWGRSNACTWVFSSKLKTTARAGGSK